MKDGWAGISVFGINLKIYHACWAHRGPKMSGGNMAKIRDGAVVNDNTNIMPLFFFDVTKKAGSEICFPSLP